MNAEILMTVGGASAFGITLYWVRRRELREKYAVAWVVLATLILVIGLFPKLLMVFATEAHLSYPAAVLFIALTLIYLFAFAVSVTLTTQYRRNIRLTQEVALMEERLRRLEAASAQTPDDRSGSCASR
jgi:hypothetical protein